MWPSSAPSAFNGAELGLLAGGLGEKSSHSEEGGVVRRRLRSGVGPLQMERQVALLRSAGSETASEASWSWEETCFPGQLGPQQPWRPG